MTPAPEQTGTPSVETAPTADPGALPTAASDTGPAAAGLTELAQQTATESAELRGPSAGAAAPATGIEHRDRWGRTFDPALHKVRGDGKPQLRDGRTLILKKGAPPGAHTVATAPVAVNRTGIQLDDGPPPGAASSAADATQPLLTQPLPFATEEQRRARARTGSKLLARGWRVIGRLLNPGAAAFTAEEGTDIPQTGEDWLYNQNVQLPVGDLTLHLVAGAEYVIRVGATPQGRDRVTDLVHWVRATFGGAAPKVTKHEAPPAAVKAEQATKPSTTDQPGSGGARDLKSTFGV